MSSFGSARGPERNIDSNPEHAPGTEGIVIVDSNLRPVALDAGAEAIFSSLAAQSNGNGVDGIPPPILNLLRSHSTPGGDSGPIYMSAGEHHFICRAFAVRPLNGGPPMLAVYLRREVSLVDAARQLAADYHLTDREEEALIGLSMGLSSKELADRMKISPNTVKAFVRMAMIKMGTNSRARLFAKLLDRQSG